MKWLHLTKINLVQRQIINILTYYIQILFVIQQLQIWRQWKTVISDKFNIGRNATHKAYKVRVFILTNIFSSECFASQQFKKTGINKFLIGGHNSWNRKIKPSHKLMSASRHMMKWRLIIQWLNNIPWFRVCEYST
jgi:hypothetical protein